MITDKELLKLAIKAMQSSYSPYSKFKVGAALLTSDNQIYTGVNIENASYSATVCAERTAFFKAVADGKRDFVAIAIAGNTKRCMPCGICRQVMSEFCNGDFKIIVEGNNSIETYSLSELLPHSFELE